MGLLKVRAWKGFAAMIGRFRTIAGGSYNMELSTTIQPVTVIDEYLANSSVVTGTGNLNGAAGSHVAMSTVPKGERWRVSIVQGGATTTASRLTVKPNPSTSHQFLDAPGTGEHLVLLGLGLVTLDEGGSIGMLSNADATDTGIGVRALIYREYVGG